MSGTTVRTPRRHLVKLDRAISGIENLHVRLFTHIVVTEACTAEDTLCAPQNMVLGLPYCTENI